MLVAFNINKEKVYSFESEKGQGPYLCPYCSESLVLKKGTKKIHHFAHQAKSDCPHENESLEHMTIKLEIFKNLKNSPVVTNLELEKYLGENRPDIYAEIRGMPVAIEVQLSNLSVEKIEERTRKYKEKGIYVLWISSYEKFAERVNLTTKTVSVKKWEKWIHAMYVGQMFLWKEGTKLIPVKFGYNGSKIERIVSSLAPIYIEKDLFPVKKPAWNKFPEAFLFNNKYAFVKEEMAIESFWSRLLKFIGLRK